MEREQQAALRVQAQEAAALEAAVELQVPLLQALEALVILLQLHLHKETTADQVPLKYIQPMLPVAAVALQKRVGMVFLAPQYCPVMAAMDRLQLLLEDQ